MWRKILCSKIGLPNILECQFPNSNQNLSSLFMEINQWILIFLWRRKGSSKGKCQIKEKRYGKL